MLSWLNIAAQRPRHGGSLLRSMTGEPLSLVLIVYTFVVAWFVGGLTVFHIYLMSTNQVRDVLRSVRASLRHSSPKSKPNHCCYGMLWFFRDVDQAAHAIHDVHSFVQTTYENFRYRYDEKENPYNRGVLANVSEVFCTGMPPSMNNFRAWVELPAPAPPEAFVDGGPFTSRNKIDLEMGHKGVQLPAGVPAILQGLHYAEMEKNSASVHIKDRQSAEAPDPFMIPEEPPHPVAGGAWSPTVFVHDDDGVE